jgi:hypothetical protein
VDDTGRIVREVKVASEPEALLHLPLQVELVQYPVLSVG